MFAASHVAATQLVATDQQLGGSCCAVVAPSCRAGKGLGCKQQLGYSTMLNEG